MIKGMAQLFQSVAYVPRHANGNLEHPDVERGIISSWNKRTIFVKFEEQISRVGWVDAQAKGCDPDDLQVCAVSPMLLLPHASASDLGVAVIGVEKVPLDTAEITTQINQYLHSFLPPKFDEASRELVCFLCGTILSGILGSFSWGLTTGEGFCGSCDYIARGLHIITVAGFKLTIPNVILQYHPSVLTMHPDEEKT